MPSISESALVQRLQRALRARGRSLRKASLKQQRSLGRYYIVSLDIGDVLKTDVDIENLARKLGVLEPWEKLGGG
jgi:hypothetical protein